MIFSGKRIFLTIAAVLVIAAMGVVAWQLTPMSASSMRSSVVIVEQKTWQEIDIDGKALLFFSSAKGDSALLGVTANRDSAVHHKYTAGCWINRWPVIPSCMGRVVTAYNNTPKVPDLKSDSDIVKLCRKSIDSQMKTLKAQKTELEYYLRVHGVQDNGYQTIAALAERVSRAYSDVAHAEHIVDSLSADKQHRFSIRQKTEYTAVFRNDEGKITRKKMEAIANCKRLTITLQACDKTTPSGVAVLTLANWDTHPERDICAVGYPGLGENGLECDTVAPIVIPGHKTKEGRHDLPNVLAADGAPVFTSKGRFIGIITKGEIASEFNLSKK